MKRALGVVVALAAVFAFSQSAGASTVFRFNMDHCGGGCGTLPLGTVTLTQGTNAVDVRVDLDPATQTFVSTGNGLDATFDFNLIDIAAGVTVTNILSGPAPGSSNWEFLGYGPHKLDGFGRFDYSIEWRGSTGGGSGSLGPLTFTVNYTGLTVDKFIELSSLADGGREAAYFGADIKGTTSNTGAIGAGCQVGVNCTPAVPEPASMLLLGSGLVGAGVFGRRRARK